MGIEEIGNEFVTILHSLMAAKMIGVAGRFLYICQTQLKGILPDTSHALVVGEEVNLAYARHHSLIAEMQRRLSSTAKRRMRKVKYLKEKLKLCYLGQHKRKGRCFGEFTTRTYYFSNN